MLDLYLLNETFTNGSSHSLLNLVSFASIFCGIFVIISKNPVVSVLFLIGLFLNIASYLMLLGINFIGLSYLLVYVGAVSILFIFILMLINVRISELTTDNTNSIPLAIMIGVFFNFTLYSLLPTNKASAFSVYKHSAVGNVNSISYPTGDLTANIRNMSAVTSGKDDISFVSSPV
jgi:NADH-ubiquinone oxidoreductase chain 6